MPISLHAAFVPSALQMLGSTRGLIDKAEQWCATHSAEPRDLIGCRLIDDMLAFDYQVKSVAVHTAGAIAGAKSGTFSPDMSDPPGSFDALRAKIDEAVAALEAAGFSAAEGEVTMIASTTVPVDADGAEKLMGLVDALEDLDDVQNVYTNIDIPDEVLAALD